MDESWVDKQELADDAGNSGPIVSGEASLSLSTVMLLTVVSLAGLMYAVLVTAKMLITTEKMRAVTFAEYLPTALLFWFWYLGVWLVQPRVRGLSR